MGRRLLSASGGPTLSEPGRAEKREDRRDDLAAEASVKSSARYGMEETKFRWKIPVLPDLKADPTKRADVRDREVILTPPETVHRIDGLIGMVDEPSEGSSRREKGGRRRGEDKRRSGEEVKK